MKALNSLRFALNSARSRGALFAGISLAVATPLLVTSCGTGVDEQAGTVLDLPYKGFNPKDVQGQKNFAYLINNFPQGKPDKQPWAGYWWPYTENGIASAKMGGGGSSPAGKYDAARGGRTASQSWEVKNHGPGVKGIQSWWGHCNGWCVAAALFEEPHDDVKVNGIRFGIADQKALLSEAGMSASADYFGTRVDFANDYNTPKYTDTIPDQYFLVLTNYMGIGKRGVLIDRYTGDQIWNQPLMGYKFKYPTPADYLGADPSAPNVYRILLTSTMYWAEDGVPADIQTPEFDYVSDGYHFSERELKMEIWLDGPVVFDADGKIVSSGNVIVTRKGDYFVGGAWRMGEGFLVDAWPDYMWVPYSIIPPDPTDDYANPHVEIDWLQKHILVPGGADDPSAHPIPVQPAPSSTPTPSSRPTGLPIPFPTFTRGPNPVPTPTGAPLPFPNPFPTR